MIPKAYITEWRTRAPWAEDAWVEQDLAISRALIEIFSVAELGERLERDLFERDFITIAPPGFRQTPQANMKSIQAVQPGGHIKKCHGDGQRSAMRFPGGVS